MLCVAREKTSRGSYAAAGWMSVLYGATMLVVPPLAIPVVVLPRPVATLADRALAVPLRVAVAIAIRVRCVVVVVVARVVAVVAVIGVGPAVGADVLIVVIVDRCRLIIVTVVLIAIAAVRVVDRGRAAAVLLRPIPRARRAVVAGVEHSAVRIHDAAVRVHGPPVARVADDRVRGGLFVMDVVGDDDACHDCRCTEDDVARRCCAVGEDGSSHRSRDD